MADKISSSNIRFNKDFKADHHQGGVLFYLSPSELTVYIRLRSWADNQGVVHCPVTSRMSFAERLFAMTGLSYNTVKKALQTLTRIKLVDEKNGELVLNNVYFDQNERDNSRANRLRAKRAYESERRKSVEIEHHQNERLANVEKAIGTNLTKLALDQQKRGDSK